MEEGKPAFPFPGPEPWDGTELDGLPEYPSGGKPAPSAEQGFLETLFPGREQSFLPVTYDLWGQDVPSELEAGERNPALEGLLSKNQLGEVHLARAAESEPKTVETLLRILEQNAPRLRVHYQVLPRGGTPTRGVVEARPVSVRIYQPGEIRAGTMKMELRYEAHVPIRKAADYSFAAEVTVPARPAEPIRRGPPTVVDPRVPPAWRRIKPEWLPKPPSPEESERLQARFREGSPGAPAASRPEEPKRYRILQPGWFRVSDGSEAGTDPAHRPGALRQLYLSDGRFLQIAFYPGRGSERLTSWSGTGLGRRIARLPDSGTILRSLVTKAVERSGSGRRVVMGADSSPRAGAVYPGGDLLDLTELSELLPLNGQDGPIDWLWRSLSDGVSVGVRRNRKRATFVVEGKTPEPVIEAAEEIVEQLGEAAAEGGALADYNAWVVIREDGTLRLHIRPRRPDTNNAYGQPVADRDYAFVRWEPAGRLRLMDEAQMERIGSSHLVPEVEPGPGLRRLYKRKGELVFGFAIDTPALLGLVMTQNEADFENPHLAAVMEKGLELASAPLDHPRVEAVRARWSGRPGNDLAAALEREKEAVRRTWEGVESVQDLIDRVRAVRDAGVKHEAAFNALTAKERNDYTRRFWELLERFRREERLRAEVISAPGRDSVEALSGIPRVVALGVPTLDLIPEVEEEAGREILRVRLMAGGAAAHIAQSLSALGFPQHLIAALGKETGAEVREALKNLSMAEAFELPAPTRISLMFPRSGNRREIRLVSPGWRDPFTAERVRAFWEKIPEAVRGAPRVVVFGERLPGEERAQAEEASAWAEGARRSGARLYIRLHPSWTRQTVETILRADPRGVFVTPEGLAQATGADLASWRSRPDRVAEWADKLRRDHGLAGWVLAALETGALVLVDDDGWRHVAPSPLHQLTYTKGTADTAFATFLRGVLSGRGRHRAAEEAVTAAAVFMGRNPAQRGLPPAPAEGTNGFTEARWPVIVDALPIPREIRAQRHSRLQERLNRAEEESLAAGARDFLAHLEARPGAEASSEAREAWWRAFFRRLPNALGALEGLSRTEPLYERLERAVMEELPPLPTGKSYGDLRAAVGGIRRQIEARRRAGREARQSGLEEAAGFSRLDRLAAARLETGVLVIPDRNLGALAGLDRLLARLPAPLASRVVVWDRTGRARGLEEINPPLRRVEGEPIDLVAYLAALEEAERVAFLEAPDWAARLRPLLAAFGLQVGTAAWNLNAVLAAMGLPEPVTRAAGLEELASEFFTRRGA